MRIDPLTKLIIDVFTKNYAYNIEEVKSKDNKKNFWAISKINNGVKEYIVFQDEINFYNLDIDHIRSSASCSINMVRVVISNKNHIEGGWGNFYNDFENQVIVVDKATGNILYRTPGAIYLANNIQSILSYYIRRKSSTKKKFSIFDVTKILIITNVIMFLISSFLSRSFMDIDTRVLIFLGSKENTLISQGQYYRFVTSMFLHGGLIHILSNMYALYILGPMIEKVYGKTKYITIYFVGGIVSSIFSYIFSIYPSVGASGAIFALLGATLVFAIKEKDRVGKAMVRNILSVIGINVLIGITVPNIDNFAHLGGLIAGIIFSVILY